MKKQLPITWDPRPYRPVDERKARRTDYVIAIVLTLAFIGTCGVLAIAAELVKRACL